MIRKFRIRLLPALAALTVALVAGCGEKEQVDPYTYASLRAVTHGHVISDNFLFEIDAPEFVLTHGNTGIIRNGNQLEILVADDLENRASSFSGKMIGVQKFFSPVVWLMAKRVKDGLNTTALDSVTAPVLPKFVSPNLEDVPGFDLGTLKWNKKEAIEDITESELQGVGTIVYREDHELIDDYDPEADVDGTGPPMAWYLRAKDSDATFKIDNVTPSLELAFKILEAEGLPFVGSVTVHDPYTYTDRRSKRISAPLSINWLRYANRYLAP